MLSPERPYRPRLVSSRAVGIDPILVPRGVFDDSTSVQGHAVAAPKHHDDYGRDRGCLRSAQGDRRRGEDHPSNRKGGLLRRTRWGCLDGTLRGPGSAGPPTPPEGGPASPWGT